MGSLEGRKRVCSGGMCESPPEGAIRFNDVEAETNESSSMSAGEDEPDPAWR